MALLCGRRDFCRALATQRVLLRSAVDLLQHDHAAVRADVLAVAEALSADHETYEVLLHSGALQGTLDLLERAALNPTGETREDAAGSGGRAAQESERRAALQILANLTRHDVSLRALFEDHPALDGVLLPREQYWGVARPRARDRSIAVPYTFTRFHCDTA